MPKHSHHHTADQIDQEVVDNIVLLMKKLGELPSLPANAVKPLYADILEAFMQPPTKHDFAEIQRRLLHGELPPDQAFTAAARLLTIPWLQLDPTKPLSQAFQAKLNAISWFAHHFTAEALKRGPEYNPSGANHETQKQRDRLLKEHNKSASSSNPAYAGRFYGSGLSDKSASDSDHAPLLDKKSKRRGSSSSS